MKTYCVANVNVSLTSDSQPGLPEKQLHFVQISFKLQINVPILHIFHFHVLSYFGIHVVK